MLGDSKKEIKRLRRENKKLTKENENLRYDINLYDRLLTALQNTIDEFISWVSSMLNVAGNKIAKKFEKDNNIFINPMQQLITEDDELRKELEERYSREG